MHHPRTTGEYLGKRIQIIIYRYRGKSCMTRASHAAAMDVSIVAMLASAREARRGHGTVRSATVPVPEPLLFIRVASG